jgi:chemotaxis protein CheC
MPVDESGCVAAPEPASSLQTVVGTGLIRAADALSEMVGVPIGIGSSIVEIVPLDQVSVSVGNPDQPAVAVYLGIQGAGRGHILLLFDEPMARRLAGLLLGEDPETLAVSDDLPGSALAEAGNVCCSAFVNVLGDAAHMRLEVTPPVVALDMRGAIMDAAAADIALEGDEAFVIGTQLTPAQDEFGERVDARLVVIPAPSTHARLLECLGEVR